MKKFNRKQADNQLLEFISICRAIYAEAESNAYSHDWIIAQRNKRIEDTESWQRLPEWAKTAYFYASHHVLFMGWQRKLIYTNVLDNKRYMVGHPIFEGRYSDIAPNSGCYCYGFLLNGEYVWVPIDNEDVEKEIQSGRLSLEDLAVIRTSVDSAEVVRLSHLDHKLCLTTQFNPI